MWAINGKQLQEFNQLSNGRLHFRDLVDSTPDHVWMVGSVDTTTATEWNGLCTHLHEVSDSFHTHRFTLVDDTSRIPILFHWNRNRTTSGSEVACGFCKINNKEHIPTTTVLVVGTIQINTADLEHPFRFVDSDRLGAFDIQNPYTSRLVEVYKLQIADLEQNNKVRFPESKGSVVATTLRPATGMDSTARPAAPKRHSLLDIIDDEKLKEFGYAFYNIQDVPACGLSAPEIWDQVDPDHSKYDTVEIVKEFIEALFTDGIVIETTTDKYVFLA